MLPRSARPVEDPGALLVGAGTLAAPVAEVPPAPDPPGAAPEDEHQGSGGGTCACPLHGEVDAVGRAALDDLFRRASQLSDVCACLVAVTLLSLLVVLMR